MKEKGFFAAVSTFFIYREDEESNLTGVARYLQEQSEPNTETGLRSEAATGVARYLNDLEPGGQNQEIADVEGVPVREAPVRVVDAPVYVNPQGTGLFSAIRSFSERINLH